MKALPFWFVVVGALLGLAGMVWGIQMSITHDHTLAPAHAHNNLVGFLLMVIYGFYYKLVPAAAGGRLAMAHFVLALIGALTIGAGVAMANTGSGEWLAQIASITTILALAVWVYTIFRYRSSLSL